MLINHDQIVHLSFRQHALENLRRGQRTSTFASLLRVAVRQGVIRLVGRGRTSSAVFASVTCQWNSFSKTRHIMLRFGSVSSAMRTRTLHGSENGAGDATVELAS